MNEIVNNGVVANVPKCKCVSFTSTYPVWYSSELKVLIELISQLFEPRKNVYNLRNFRTLKKFTLRPNYSYYSVINRLRRSWNLFPDLLKSLNNFNKIFNLIVLSSKNVFLKTNFL